MNAPENTSTDLRPEDVRWEVGAITLQDGREHYAVMQVSKDEAGQAQGSVICWIGPVGDERDEEYQARARLIASVPEAAFYLDSILKDLEALVLQYPEGPNNKTPAGQCARRTLRAARLAISMSKAVHTPQKPA